MSMLSYVIKTDWKTKKEDWRAYRELCNFLETAHTAVLVHRADITQVLTEDMDPSKRPACIRRVIESFQSTAILEADQINSLRPYVWEKKCKHYGKMSCGKTDCAYYARNAQYCDVRNLYVDALNKKQNFWRTRFANVK